MINRRISERFKLHQMIEISFSKEESFINATSLDISETGIKCRLRNPIKASSEIFLMFELTGEEQPYIIKCFGEILWQNKIDNEYFAGLCFKHLSDKDKKQLNSYLDTLEK